MYKNIKVEAEHDELILENSNGDKVIIPANKRNWVKQKLSEGCDGCIDSLVETLPVAADYAEDGSLFPDWNTIKANHPTFSNESKYHNVDGNIGGSWMEKILFPHEKQMGDTPRYVAPDLLEVEITPEGTELKDQPKELESYYRDYAAQYPREAYIQFRKENPIGREKIKAINSKNWNDYIEKQANKEYKDRIRNYAGEQLVKENPQGDRNRKDYLNSFTSQELAVLRNSESKGKVNPTLMQKFEGALKQGAAAGAPGDLRYKKVETESLTDEEMKDVGGLDLLGPLLIPTKLVQAGYKDGYSFLDALKGQENNASLIEDILTDPLNLVGLGLVSKGASTAQLLKAYKNLAKLSNPNRVSTLQNAYKLNPFAFKPNPEAYYRGVGKEGIKDALETGVIKSRDTDLFPSPYFARPNEFETALYYNPEALIEAKGIDVSKVKNIEPNQLIFKNKDAGAVPLNSEYVDEIYLGNVSQGFKQSGLENIPISNPNIRLLQKDWLRGYKEIKVPNAYSKVNPLASKGKPESISFYHAGLGPTATIDNYKYPSQLEAVQARAERMLSQENKWIGQNNAELKYKFNNAQKNHNPASDYPGEKLGTNKGNTTEISKDANLNDANKARVAAHETGHYYRNRATEANEWNSFFDFSNLEKHKTRTYLRGKPTAVEPGYVSSLQETQGLKVGKDGVPHGDEIRERAAQLKDHIAQKNNIPLNEDFTVTETQLNDAIKNYVKDTGLDNNMTQMLSSLKDKKGFLKAMNKYALTTTGIIGTGAAGTAMSQEKAMGGYIDTNPPQEPSLLTSLKQSYFNPYNWGVPDYTDKGNFDSAYNSARKAQDQNKSEK